MTRYRLAFCYASVATFVLGALSPCVFAGEKIIFSKPDTDIVVPKQENSRLPVPSTEIRGSGFSAPQQEMPFIPPPQPRNGESKKTERKSVYDEPDLFSTKPDGSQANEQDPIARMYG